MVLGDSQVQRPFSGLLLGTCFTMCRVSGAAPAPQEPRGISPPAAAVQAAQRCRSLFPAPGDGDEEEGAGLWDGQAKQGRQDGSSAPVRM